jgi:hypothetical protein
MNPRNETAPADRFIKACLVKNSSLVEFHNRAHFAKLGAACFGSNVERGPAKFHHYPPLPKTNAFDMQILVLTVLEQNFFRRHTPLEKRLNNPLEREAGVSGTYLEQEKKYDLVVLILDCYPQVMRLNHE